LPTSEHVKLAIYDTNGKLVRVLLDGVRGYGRHEVEWNGTDSLGNRVGSGVYFYRLEAGSFRQSMKMLLVK
jgi:flagellar hook assembly protein FlgD